jgi:hypothetical protein
MYPIWGTIHKVEECINCLIFTQGLVLFGKNYAQRLENIRFTGISIFIFEFGYNFY